MHNTALNYYGIDAHYFAIDLQNQELGQLASFLNRDSFLGANITVPYKQLIGDYLDQIDHSANLIGAVNTIVKDDYYLTGYNTDIYGFLAPLRDLEDEIADSDAIIFGTGGAAGAVVAGLIELGVQGIYLVSRNPDRITSFREMTHVHVISYHEWTSRVEDVSIIVNATPLGMHPKIDQSPVRDSEKQFLADCICYDIVYNPLRTKFLKQAKSVGTQTIGGLEMLIEQGSRSFQLWTGKSFPVEIIRKKLHERIEN